VAAEEKASVAREDDHRQFRTRQLGANCGWERKPEAAITDRIVKCSRLTAGKCASAPARDAVDVVEDQCLIGKNAA
jgi:hypothetical protein